MDDVLELTTGLAALNGALTALNEIAKAISAIEDDEDAKEPRQKKPHYYFYMLVQVPGMSDIQYAREFRLPRKNTKCIEKDISMSPLVCPELCGQTLRRHAHNLEMTAVDARAGAAPEAAPPAVSDRLEHQLTQDAASGHVSPLVHSSWK